MSFVFGMIRLPEPLGSDRIFVSSSRERMTCLFVREESGLRCYVVVVTDDMKGTCVGTE